MAPVSSATTTTSLAPGFRFHPTDEELVLFYLKQKVRGKSIRYDAIPDVDIYKFEPWELPGHSKLKGRDRQWYFFTALDKKFGNGPRVNRATQKGYWKATGKDRLISHNSCIIGMKKTLVFYSGRAPLGKRTNWVMHEYRLVDDKLEKDQVLIKDALLCKIIEKSELGSKLRDQCPPFMEEELDNDISGLVPEEEAEEEVVVGANACNGKKNFEQVFGQTTANINANVPWYSENAGKLSHICKIEESDDSPSLSLSSEKRPRHNDSDTIPSNASGSANPRRDPCSSEKSDDSPSPHMYKEKRLRHLTPSNASEIATPIRDPCPSAATTITTTINFPSSLLELPLLDSLEPKENKSKSSLSFAAANLGSGSPGYMKLFHDLRNEVHGMFFEKEALKIEVMRAQAMINILQSQIDVLVKENKDLKKASRDV